MAEKDLNYNITANDSSFQKGAGRTTAAMSKMEREARRLEQQQRRTHAAMEMVGRGMLVAGAAIAAGLALSVRAAIDWESAWAGVLKTVDGTPEQMAALEKEIRGLTAVLPASHQEIAAVAEAAGQLGVQRENVLGFTRVMIDMGEATNLSATDAATALARFMNIMQTAPSNVDRLGSSIVDLGNNSATTEAEIVDMSLRIAGAGRAVGLTEAEVLGFSAALSSVGIAAESGGSAISRVFIQIDKSVRAGGDSLDVFAETAGMSAEQFRQAYQEDAAGAINAFVQGLGRIQAQGGDVNATLDQLGFTNIRVSDALRRLSGAGDLLTRSLSTGSQAWDENEALAAEAERRYGTTAAQMAIARNQVNDLGISIGSTLLPVLGDAVTHLANLASIVGQLPEPIKATLAVVATLAAGLLLAGGAALIAVPRIVAFKQALDQIALSGGRAAAGVGAFRAASSFMLGPWGAAIAAAVTVATLAFGAWATEQAAARQASKELADTLDEVTGGFTDATSALVAHKLEEEAALGAARSLGLELSEVVDAVLAGEDATAAMAERINELGIATLGADGAFTDFGNSTKDQRVAIITIMDAVAQLGGELDEGTKQWLRTTEAQEGSADAVERLDPASRQLAGALELTAGEAGDLTDQVEDLEEALDSILGFMFNVEEAQDATARALREVTDAAKENGTALEGNSEAALDNRDNVRALIDADFDLIKALSETTTSETELIEETEKLKQKFIEQMRQAGFSEEAVEKYAAAYDEIPAVVSSLIKTPGMTAAEKNARNLKHHIDRIPKNVRINVDIHQAGTLPSIGRGKNQAMQHGGEVGGAFEGTDRRLIAATTGEFVVRRGVAQQNLAALRAFNVTGRWPTRPGVGSTSTGNSAAAMPGHAQIGAFEGELFLDSGQFLGVVKGQIRNSQSEHDRSLNRRAGAGAGRAR